MVWFEGGHAVLGPGDGLNLHITARLQRSMSQAARGTAARCPHGCSNPIPHPRPITADLVTDFVQRYRAAHEGTAPEVRQVINEIRAQVPGTEAALRRFVEDALGSGIGSRGRGDTSEIDRPAPVDPGSIRIDRGGYERLRAVLRAALGPRDAVEVTHPAPRAWRSTGRGGWDDPLTPLAQARGLSLEQARYRLARHLENRFDRYLDQITTDVLEARQAYRDNRSDNRDNRSQDRPSQAQRHRSPAGTRGRVGP